MTDDRGFDFGRGNVECGKKECGSRKKSMPMEPGNKLAEKSIF
jgi:hypothetical protein